MERTSMTMIEKLEKKMNIFVNHLDLLQIYWADITCNEIIDFLNLGIISKADTFQHYYILIEKIEGFISTLIPDLTHNWPFVYNSYQILFKILVQIENFSKIHEIALKLSNVMKEIEFSSNEEIAEFLESFISIYESRGELQKIFEIFVICSLLRKKLVILPNIVGSIQLFMDILNQLLPEHRILFYHSLILGVVEKMSIFSNNSLNEFSNILQNENFMDKFPMISKIAKRFMSPSIDTNFLDEYIQIFDDLIIELQNLNQSDWALLISKNYCQNLILNDRLKESIQFIQHFAYQNYIRGNYQTTYFANEFLLNLQKDEEKQFQFRKIKIWADSAKKFRNLEDKSFFTKSMRNLDELLRISPKITSLTDYSYSVNEYYSLARGYMQTEAFFFWWAAFHRSIFEEPNEKIANLALMHLNLDRTDELIQYIRENTQKTRNAKDSMASKTRELNIGGMNPQRIIIKLRFQLHKSIKLFSEILYNTNFSKIEEFNTEELWAEPILRNLYLNIQYSDEEQIETIKNDPICLSPEEFGQLAYLFLPKTLREYLNDLHLDPGHRPEIYVIIDEPVFPLEMLHDGTNSLGSKFAFGYRFREPKLHQPKIQIEEKSDEATLKFSILGIGDLNQENPKRWDNELEDSTPIIKFDPGKRQLHFLESKLDNLQTFIHKFISISPPRSTKEIIERELRTGSYNIIYITTSLFFNELNPEDSYFICSDNNILSINEIISYLSYAKQRNQMQGIPYFLPLFIFDGQILDSNNKLIQRSLFPIFQITKSISSKTFLGMLMRISTEFNEILELFLGEFLNHILLNESIGTAILQATRQMNNFAQQFQKSSEISQNYHQILRETHYIFIGDPFLKLE